MEKDFIEEVIENADTKDINNNDNFINETLDNSGNNNFETVIKERNLQSQQGKEELNSIIEDNETKDKPNNTLKLLGVSLLCISVIGLIFTTKNTKNPQNRNIEDMSNE